jgi:hypothetical protein
MSGAGRPETVELVPEDDNFHEPGEDPHETETFWASFHDPDRRLGGWFYNQVLFNRGLCNGGAWVWDDSAEGAVHESIVREAPLGDGAHLDLRDAELPNGNHIEMTEPLRRFRIRREDPGKFEADLVFEALREPHSHPLGVAPFWKGRHFDQAMHVTGRIVLLGEAIAIDSLSVRDRSWGPRPPRRRRDSEMGERSGGSRVGKARPDCPPWAPFGVGYVFGTQDANEMFLAYTLPGIWDGKARDPVTTGYLVRDGRYGLLVEGSRRSSLDPERGWIDRIWLEATDEHGRTLSAIGKLVSHHGTEGLGTGYFHWEWDGANGYGEDQSMAPPSVVEALERERLWV